MAAIGARMLAADKRAAESAQAEAIRRAGEQSALTAVGAAVSEALSQALEWMVRWAGLSGRAGLSLNTDFLPLPMSAAELTAHVHAWQAGSLSDGELFDALKAGEIIRGSRTFEEHAAETSAPLDTGDHA